MQIEILEKQKNNRTCYDDIRVIKQLGKFLFIEDKNGWSTRILIIDDMEVNIKFYELN